MSLTEPSDNTMTNGGENNYLFSVVIPVYNTEEYLSDAIDSIIGQSIGFKQNIQLILVNDGSTDGSGDICLRYKDKYPNNIIYVSKENGGVASACNVGIEHAEGLIINFFGSDDIWGPDSFRSVGDFFKLHFDEVDIVTSKMTLFGVRNGSHPLNYKYDNDAVVDLNEHPEYFNIASGNCFIKRSSIGNRRFDERLTYAEDAVFVSEIFLDKCSCGVVKNAEYFYRTRPGSLSSAKSKKRRFTIDPKLFALKLFEMSRMRYGEVKSFIAYAVMYEMQWRITEQPSDDITREEIDEYEGIIKELLAEIDDRIIYEQKSLPVVKRLYVYRLKYGDEALLRGTWNRGRICFGDMLIWSLNSRARLIVHIAERKGSKLVLKCKTDMDATGLDYSIFMMNQSGHLYQPEIQYFPTMDMKAFNGEVIIQGKALVFQVPFKDGAKYSFYVRFDGKDPHLLKPSFTRFGKLDHNLEKSFWVAGKHIVKFENNYLSMHKKSKRAILSAELNMLKQQVTYGATEQAIYGKHPIIRLRVLYDITRPFLKKKRIWVVCDRNEHATDNGAAFFRYATQQIKAQSLPIRVYFVLDKKSVDYRNLSTYGRIVKPNSLEHKLLVLHAEKLISSQADDAVLFPFSGQRHFLNGLMNYQFVYLQHGVMQGDLSSWLNVLNKNIKLLAVSTNMEMEYILANGFGYSEREVKMIGSMRFDSLSQYETKKKIAFMPTWRSSLAGKFDRKTRTRDYVESFTETDYYKFYNSLINDERLIAAMREFGYEGEFYLHPCFAAQADDFVGNDVIRLRKEEADYLTVLGESALLVTDYSGVQFDFAYQRKPVVYSQFDDIYADDGSHSYNGAFFDYKTMAFGPVAHTLDEVVFAIIDLLHRNCSLTDEYQRRIDDFFFFNDDENSKRAFEAVLDL